MTYTLAATIALPWAEAVEKTRDALAEQGFGILTEIDVRATFEKKLGAEAADAVGDYVILGACNPALASRALAAEPQMGALLPCNVVVYQEDGGTTHVAAIDPLETLAAHGEPGLQEIAREVHHKLERVISRVGERV